MLTSPFRIDIEYLQVANVPYGRPIPRAVQYRLPGIIFPSNGLPTRQKLYKKKALEVSASQAPIENQKPNSKERCF